MAKLTRKQLDEKIKVGFLERVADYLTQADEEVLRVGSNELAIPVLDENSEERWLVLTFKVPTGSRLDGEPYDGYSAKEDYEMKLAEKVKKAEEKAKKAEKDKAKRAAKAKSE